MCQSFAMLCTLHPFNFRLCQSVTDDINSAAWNVCSLGEALCLGWRCGITFVGVLFVCVPLRVFGNFLILRAKSQWYFLNLKIFK